MQALTLATQICGGAIAAFAQPDAPPPVDIIILPSEGLERARPRITLSTFVVHPGPQIEALMRSAAFLATENKYDI